MNLLSMTYTDVVVDFDVNLLRASKLVNTKYILFEKEADAYRQLCIKHNNQEKMHYVESFFYEKSDDYIKGQRVDKILSMKVIAYVHHRVFERDNFVFDIALYVVAILAGFFLAQVLKHLTVEKGWRIVSKAAVWGMFLFGLLRTVMFL